MTHQISFHQIKSSEINFHQINSVLKSSPPHYGTCWRHHQKEKSFRIVPVHDDYVHADYDNDHDEDPGDIDGSDSTCLE